MLTFAIVIFFLSTPIRGLTLTLHPLGNSIKMNNKKIGGFAFGLFFLCVCLLGRNNKKGLQVPNLYKAQYLETVIFKQNGKLVFSPVITQLLTRLIQFLKV